MLDDSIELVATSSWLLLDGKFLTEFSNLLILLLLVLSFPSKCFTLSSKLYLLTSSSETLELKVVHLQFKTVFYLFDSIIEH